MQPCVNKQIGQMMLLFELQAVEGAIVIDCWPVTKVGIDCCGGAVNIPTDIGAIVVCLVVVVVVADVAVVDDEELIFVEGIEKRRQSCWCWCCCGASISVGGEVHVLRTMRSRVPRATSSLSTCESAQSIDDAGEEICRTNAGGVVDDERRVTFRFEFRIALSAVHQLFVSKSVCHDASSVDRASRNELERLESCSMTNEVIAARSVAFGWFHFFTRRSRYQWCSAKRTNDRSTNTNFIYF